MFQTPGSGSGLVGTQRLMDDFKIDSGAGQRHHGASRRNASRRRKHFTEAELKGLQQRLNSAKARDPLAELEQQNRELMAALEQLRQKNGELDHLNQELDDTNRGVVALYAELDERADFLQRTSELKTRFLSNMSHEFRTPLNSIISLSQLLMDRVDGELSEEQEKQVDVHPAFGRHLARTGHRPAGPREDRGRQGNGAAQSIRGRRIVRRAARHATPLTEESECDYSPSKKRPSLELFTDESKVSQILRNFVSNALEIHSAGRGERDRAGRAARYRDLLGARYRHRHRRADQLRVFEEFTQIDSAFSGRRKEPAWACRSPRSLPNCWAAACCWKVKPGRAPRSPPSFRACTREQ